MEFNADTGEFFGQYQLNVDCVSFTVVYISEFVKGPAWYPDGAKVTVTGPDDKPLNPDKSVYEKGNNRYKVLIEDPDWDDETVTIRISVK